MNLCLKEWKNKQKFQELVFLTSTLNTICAAKQT